MALLCKLLDPLDVTDFIVCFWRIVESSFSQRTNSLYFTELPVTEREKENATNIYEQIMNNKCEAPEAFSGIKIM